MSKSAQWTAVIVVIILLVIANSVRESNDIQAAPRTFEYEVYPEEAAGTCWDDYGPYAC
jgi:hypothetical protein